MDTDSAAVLAELAKQDINIFNAHVEGGTWVIEYEYGWQPTDYRTKWTKAIYMLDDITSLAEALEHVLREVEAIRAELN